MPITINVPGIVIPSDSTDGIDLASAAYVQRILTAGGLAPTSAQLVVLSPLITAASREIIRFCGRPFALQAFDEIVTPSGQRYDRGEVASAKLSYFPVVEVTSVECGRTTALTITNTATSTNQRARVAFAYSGDPEYLNLTYTGLKLTRVASGVTTDTALNFSDYPTLTALATAINALSGSGWRATVAAGAALYPSADLVGAREPKEAFAGAGLDLFMHSAASYDVERDSGILRCWDGNSVWNDPSFGPSDGWGGGWGGGWAGGYGQYRVRYTAGFATVPESIALVVAEAVKLMFHRLLLDLSLKSETTGSYTWAARDAIGNLSDGAMATLQYFKDWKV